MARKTISFEELKDIHNQTMRFSADGMTTEREAIFSLVSEALVRHDAYRGFRWIQRGGDPVPVSSIAADGLYDNTRRELF